MADNERQISLTRGRTLAAEMFQALVGKEETMTDICVAIAALTIGIMHQRTKNAEDAKLSIADIRHLEDKWLTMPWPNFDNAPDFGKKARH